MSLLCGRTFNSLSRDHVRMRVVIGRNKYYCLSTPSLGITKVGYCEPESTVVGDFQLPLSGSRSIGIGTERKESMTFNSLSRDHSSPASRGPTSSESSAFNSLSRDHELPVDREDGSARLLTFNSLSRDHILEHNWQFTIVIEHMAFQLPLSGSRREMHNCREGLRNARAFNSLSRDHIESQSAGPSRHNYVLSTPSLGITIV